MLFHDTETFLVDSVAAFLDEALAAGGAVLVVATPEHRKAFAAALASRTGSVPPNRLRWLDAEEALAGFMVDGQPDRARFEAVVGTALDSVARGAGGLRAYGEMVALLWARGERNAAIVLEQLWNELLSARSFALLCAYPSAAFRDPADDAAFTEVCGCHTRVIPEAPVSLAPPQPTTAENARALLAAIVDSSDDAIVSKTLQGVITSWNKGAEQLFGYTAQEAVGRSIELIFPPDRYGEEDVILGRIQRGERIDHFETQRQTKDGRILDVLLTVSPLRDAAGKIVGVSKIARDITARVRAEQALRELNATLEQSVRERTAEASGRAQMARELAMEITRTEQRERHKLADLLHDELAQWLALARLILTGLEARSPELRSIAELQAVKEILGKSIDFTRSLFGELVPPALHDAGFRAAIHELAGRLMQRHELTVTVQGTGQVLVSEEHLIFLFRATRELLTNVIKHAKANRALVTIDAHDGLAKVTVEDAGAGFDPAFPTDPPGERRGFGLFSIRERASLLGAEFEIHSGPGRGTRCTLTVPLVRSEPPPPAGAPE